MASTSRLSALCCLFIAAVSAVACDDEDASVAGESTKTLHVGGKDWVVPETCCEPSETFTCMTQMPGGKRDSSGRCPQNYDGPQQIITGFVIGADGCLYSQSKVDSSKPWCGLSVDAGADVRDTGTIYDAAPDASPEAG